MNAKIWGAIAVALVLGACGAKKEAADDAADAAADAAAASADAAAASADAAAASADAAAASADAAAAAGDAAGDAAAAAGDSAAAAAAAPYGPTLDDSPGDDIVSFPWPPPAPTTQAVLDRALLARNAATLGDVAERLTTALEGLGYSEHSFYRAPGGFVLATRLEQIEFDGRPKAKPLRWSAELPPREIFSLGGFIDALFSAPEGHYRVIVFVVNDQPFSATGRAVSQEEALAWLRGGLNRLPESIATAPLKNAHIGTALIYQFRKVGQNRAAVANPDGAEPAMRHLERSGILTALRQ